MANVALALATVYIALASTATRTTHGKKHVFFRAVCFPGGTGVDSFTDASNGVFL